MMPVLIVLVTVLTGAAAAVAQTQPGMPQINQDTSISLGWFISALAAVGTGVGTGMWWIRGILAEATVRDLEVKKRLEDGDERMKRMEKNISAIHRIVLLMPGAEEAEREVRREYQHEYVSPDSGSRG